MGNCSGKEKEMNKWIPEYWKNDPINDSAMEAGFNGLIGYSSDGRNAFEEWEERKTRHYKDYEEYLNSALALIDSQLESIHSDILGTGLLYKQELEQIYNLLSQYKQARERHIWVQSWREKYDS